MLGNSALPVRSVSIVGAFGLTITVTCGLDSATDLSGWVAVAVYLKTPAVSWRALGVVPFQPHSTPFPRPFGAFVYWLESTRPFHVFNESPTVTVTVWPSSGCWLAESFPTWTGTSIFSVDLSGYVIFTTAFLSVPAVLVSGFETTSKIVPVGKAGVPGLAMTFPLTSSSVILWLNGTVSVFAAGVYFSACSCTSNTKYPVVVLVPSVEIARAVYLPFQTPRPTVPVTLCPNGEPSVAVPLTGVKLKPLCRFSVLKFVTFPLSSVVMRRVFTSSPRYSGITIFCPSAWVFPNSTLLPSSLAQ